MTEIILFSEDTLIEQAAQKIIAVENSTLTVSNVMGRRGFSYFQSRIAQIRRSAVSLKFLIFLDGDELGTICPGNAIEQWFHTRHPDNIHVRFAFHEVESWLLADRHNLATFLNVSASAIPVVGDKVRNTKELLIQLARRSRSREILQDLVPPSGYTSPVGPAYNARISEFIQNNWDVKAASAVNDSLARACRRVSEIK
ncbi:hypothetical protein [Bradyrhizobium oligotrophicum]|uniref:hypothetical protein n=1 Tax=Bradyrhizobium oligotrophicum TaxID=44255 RepID=UPI001181ABE9|nr:hypothetical protein [Bradyrhizobium oligotrophicum]